jgi:hypothetical protein
LLVADLVMADSDLSSPLTLAPGRYAGSWQEADSEPHGPGAHVTLSFTDLNGSPITSVTAGDEFQVQIYLQDIRSIEQAIAGVVSAYLDLEFDPSQLEVTRPIEFGDAYQLLPDGGTITDGEITDINAATNFIDY